MLHLCIDNIRNMYVCIIFIAGAVARGLNRLLNLFYLAIKESGYAADFGSYITVGPSRPLELVIILKDRHSVRS